MGNVQPRIVQMITLEKQLAELMKDGRCVTENLLLFISVPQYYNHQQSFRNKDYKNSTTLSTYLRSIKSTSEEQNVNLSWEIMRQAASYSNISKQCLLYLHEKLAIALYPNPEELLNKRSEMISKCRHLNKFLLMNFNSND